MSAKQLMIYGAYGYTGELIAREALKNELNPILAGRDENRIQALAVELGLEHRSFALDNQEYVTQQLADVDVLIHCAGPFADTAEVMIHACLQAKTHYADVTGETSVFELAHSLNDDARSAGIVLCPGVGFDVIPADCLAAIMAQRVDNITMLSLAIDAELVLSPGSVKTMVQSFARPGGSFARVDGEWVRENVKPKFRSFTINGTEKFAVSMPLSDLLAAGYSTDIPTIDVYQTAPPERIAFMQKMGQLGGLLAQDDVRELVLTIIDATVEGPGTERRSELPHVVVAEAIDINGDTTTITATTPNGYSLTRDGALACARIMLEFEGTGGYYTPSMLGGSELLSQLPGVVIEG